MSTFADLSIDIPLFAADAAEAAGWQPHGRCLTCLDERPGFTLGIGSHIEVACPNCATASTTPATGRPSDCTTCQRPVSLGRDATGNHGCWQCLRGGRWATTIDTEAGLVTPDDAKRGHTLGLPLPATGTLTLPGATTVAATPMPGGWPYTTPDEHGWCQAIIPPEVLVELTRTPGYLTWQGESWLFHCHTAMCYLGRWGKDDIVAAAGNDDPRTLAQQAAGLDGDAWDYLAATPQASAINLLMFRCTHCTTLRGHWEID